MPIFPYVHSQALNRILANHPPVFGLSRELPGHINHAKYFSCVPSLRRYQISVCISNLVRFFSKYKKIIFLKPNVYDHADSRIVEGHELIRCSAERTFAYVRPVIH